MGAIKVLIVDDHQMVAQAFKETLNRAPEIDVLGIASTGREGIEMAQSMEPDVVLMDFRLDDISGTEATREILRNRPEAKVIMVTGEVAESMLVSAIEAGCVGYITKGSDVTRLADAVHRANEGESLVSRDMLPKILHRIRAEANAQPVRLSKRELEVLQMLSEGKSNDQIASDLYLSVHTVRTHCQNIITKLGAHSKLEAVAMAVRRSMVRLD